MACKRCGKSVDADEFADFVQDVIPHLDLCGVESLTDTQQAVYEGIGCPSCYEEVDA